jgi:hypothetical protein
MNMFPNPSNGMLNFTFDAKEPGRVTIDITDLSGRIVKEIYNDNVSGKQTITANLNELSNGMYVARVTSNGVTNGSRIVLSR